MRYSTIDHAQEVAAAYPASPRSMVSYGRRLARWAAALDEHLDGPLNLIPGTEFVSEEARAPLQKALSPISIAFADPTLRADGLSGETYGDALTFFGLNHGTLHDIVCYCHYRSSRVSPAEVAARVIRAARRAQRAERFLSAVGLRGTGFGSFMIRMYV